MSQQATNEVHSAAVQMPATSPLSAMINSRCSSTHAESPPKYYFSNDLSPNKALTPTGVNESSSLLASSNAPAEAGMQVSGRTDGEKKVWNGVVDTLDTVRSEFVSGLKSAFEYIIFPENFGEAAKSPCAGDKLRLDNNRFIPNTENSEENSLIEPDWDEHPTFERRDDYDKSNCHPVNAEGFYSANQSVVSIVIGSRTGLNTSLSGDGAESLPPAIAALPPAIPMEKKTTSLPISLQGKQATSLPLSLRDEPATSFSISLRDEPATSLPILLQDEQATSLPISLQDEQATFLPSSQPTTRTRSLPPTQLTRSEATQVHSADEGYDESPKSIRQTHFETKRRKSILFLPSFFRKSSGEKLNGAPKPFQSMKNFCHKKIPFRRNGSSSSNKTPASNEAMNDDCQEHAFSTQQDGTCQESTECGEQTPTQSVCEGKVVAIDQLTEKETTNLCRELLYSIDSQASKLGISREECLTRLVSNQLDNAIVFNMNNPPAAKEGTASSSSTVVPRVRKANIFYSRDVAMTNFLDCVSPAVNIISPIAQRCGVMISIDDQLLTDQVVTNQGVVNDQEVVNDPKIVSGTAPPSKRTDDSTTYTRSTGDFDSVSSYQSKSSLSFLDAKPSSAIHLDEEGPKYLQPSRHLAKAPVAEEIKAPSRRASISLGERSVRSQDYTNLSPPSAMRSCPRPRVFHNYERNGRGSSRSLFLPTANGRDAVDINLFRTGNQSTNAGNLDSFAPTLAARASQGRPPFKLGTNRKSFGARGSVVQGESYFSDATPSQPSFETIAIDKRSRSLGSNSNGLGYRKSYHHNAASNQPCPKANLADLHSHSLDYVISDDSRLAASPPRDIWPSEFDDESTGCSMNSNYIPPRAPEFRCKDLPVQLVNNVEQNKRKKSTSFEVDYSQATRLFKLLQAKDWEAALNRVTEAPEEASIWVCRRTSILSGAPIKWRILPVHAACIFGCPAIVVEALLCVYPDATQMKDHGGRLPIHMAAYACNDINLVRTLLRHAPDTWIVKDEKGLNAVQLTMKSNGPAKKEVILALKEILVEASQDTEPTQMNIAASAPKVLIETRQDMETTKTNKKQSAAHPSSTQRRPPFRTVKSLGRPSSVLRTAKKQPEQLQRFLV